MKHDRVSVFSSFPVTGETVRVRVSGIGPRDRVVVSFGNIDLMMEMETLQHLTCAAADVLDEWFTKKEAGL